ncbi:MAG: hypothetical protein ACRD9L_16635, partial [Bryobacteraceae bacterium]
ADLIGSPFLDPNRPRSQVVSEWFNTSVFFSQTQASNGFDGTVGLGILDGPGLKNVDLGIYRELLDSRDKEADVSHGNDEFL